MVCDEMSLCTFHTVVNIRQFGGAQFSMKKRMIYLSFIRVNACKQTPILEQLTNGDFVIMPFACFHLD